MSRLGLNLLGDWGSNLGSVYNTHMRIVSWNVNGIRAVHKKGLFEPFIKQLKPDIDRKSVV